MKIVANLPDINQLFNDGLKDIFPYSNIRVCVIHRVSGEILHIFRDIGKPIRFKDFAFNIKEHDLGLYIPSFYAKRNWKSNDICEDSILTIGANTVSFNGYDAMPIFIRPDGTVRKYVVVGLTRGVIDNGVLRSIPGRYPSSGYTIEEFRTAVRKGRDPKKWGLMNQDMFDCLQLLFKFAFQVTKTKEALGNGLGREKCLTGGTLVLGGQSGYTDPFQFGKDKPDARLKSLICVVDGRLQFSNWDGKFSPIKIANNKTLDECIVEETEDYIIYSDGEVTVDNPIPEGIYFACRVDKHTGEIYYGEGYENIYSKIKTTVFNGTTAEDVDSYTTRTKLISLGTPTSASSSRKIIKSYLKEDVEYFVAIKVISYNEDRQVFLDKKHQFTLHRHAFNQPTDFTIKKFNEWCIIYKTTKNIIEDTNTQVYFRFNPETNTLNEEVTYSICVIENGDGVGVIKTKCPTGKITQITDSSILNSSLLIDNQEVNYTSLFSQTVTRDETNPTTILTPSNPELKITPIRPDLNQPYLDTFTENGIYPFNLMGRYILHKDTGEILERLSPFDSTLNFYGAPSIFDPSIHDIHTLFFPFYAKRSWKGEFLSDTMVFEIPKTTHRNGFEVMPIFRDANGNLRPFVSCGAFKGSVVDNQLRSLPEKLPVVSLTIDQARTYARTNRDSKFNIETLDFITMVQFLYKIAFQDLNSQKILGNGWTNKSVKVKTGATMWIGNKSGSHDNPFFNGDVPDSRLRASLVYVNGRLEYYTDPNEPIEIEIANNKTLDECIVEETEDYIIYSDGEVTPENPIPEGIYFACRVDKHTGEIYYGEGYQNYWRQHMQDRDGFAAGTIDTPYNETTMVSSFSGQNLEKRDLWYDPPTAIPFKGIDIYHQASFKVEFELSERMKSRVVSIAEHGGSPNSGYISSVSRNFDIEHGVIEVVNKQVKYNKVHGTIGDPFIYFGKENIVFEPDLDWYKHIRTISTATTTVKPFVKTKCPVGKIRWVSSTSNISHLTHSFIIKNLKMANRQDLDQTTGNITQKNSIYIMDNMEGEVIGIVPATHKIYNGDVFLSNTIKIYKAESSVACTADANYKRRLSLTPNSSDSRFNRYKSMSGFYIYKGDFTEAEFNAEISKNIEPVSVSRANSNANGNQITLFGIEDFYGNVWSFVDGAVVKDTGIFYTMNPNDYGFNGDRYATQLTFTPPMGVNAGEQQNGYVKNMQKVDGFINYPREVNGSSTTYYSDYHWSHKRGQINIFLFGTRWANGSHSGCFSWTCEWVFSTASSNVGCRLTYLPEGIPNTNTEEV